MKRNRRGKIWLLLPLLGSLGTLSGCGGFSVPTNLSGSLPAKGSIIPATNIQLTPSLGIALEKVVFWGAYAGAAYLILDPLAPNWEIEEAKFDETHVHFSLKMRRYYAGGAGEARVVFHRQAKELMRQGGFADYEVLEYSESLESSVLGSQRTAEGVILLKKAAA